MSTVFIIHGAYGNPEENWIPWLKRELETIGHRVIVPQFPTPEGQSLKSWLAAFDPYLTKVNEGTIFIGHSIACAFILRLLETRKAKAAYLVAGFTGLLNNEFDEINKTISDRQFDWETIRENCPSFAIFHSDNDPYVPLSKAEELTQNLNSQVTMVPGAGHFNTVARYTEFPMLLEQLIKNV